MSDLVTSNLSSETRVCVCVDHFLFRPLRYVLGAAFPTSHLVEHMGEPWDYEMRCNWWQPIKRSTNMRLHYACLFASCVSVRFACVNGRALKSVFLLHLLSRGEAFEPPV